MSFAIIKKMLFYNLEIIDYKISRQQRKQIGFVSN